MIQLSLSEIANQLGGQLVGDDCVVDSVCTDSRTLKSNELFIALKGPNFNAHSFIANAKDIGASGAIVEVLQEVDLPQIVVEDTKAALGALGAYVKQTLMPKTVAITGSSGKTTVKEMVTAILSRLGNVLATKGNFNNDIGVPLTLLRLEPEHTFAVIELGANHLGEIAYTTQLTKPDVAVINNIAASHLEGFGDLCGVARAKGEIFDGLSSSGVALYNLDTQLASKWQWRLTDKTVRTFSCTKPTDAYCSDVVLDENGCANFKLNTYKGSIYIELAVPGRHNVCNAVAAAAVALEFGASLEDIRLGLMQMSAVKGRLNLKSLANNIRLIDDTYNANVESTKAAIELLASYPGRHILVLGDMGELGHEARQYHQEIGEFARDLAIGNVLTLGVLSQAASSVLDEKGEHFSSRAPLIERLQQLMHNESRDTTILVKGSRSSHMELVVADIEAWVSKDIGELN